MDRRSTSQSSIRPKRNCKLPAPSPLRWSSILFRELFQFCSSLSSREYLYITRFISTNRKKKEFTKIIYNNKNLQKSNYFTKFFISISIKLSPIQKISSKNIAESSSKNHLFFPTRRIIDPGFNRFLSIYEKKTDKRMREIHPLPFSYHNQIKF